MKQQYLVTVEIPEGCSVEQIRRYIKDAVGFWCKGDDPDDALFHLNYRKVKVETVKCPMTELIAQLRVSLKAVLAKIPYSANFDNQGNNLQWLKEAKEILNKLETP